MEVSPACTLYYHAFRDIHVIYIRYPIIEKKALVVKNRIAAGLLNCLGIADGYEFKVDTGLSSVYTRNKSMCQCVSRRVFLYGREASKETGNQAFPVICICQY